MARGESVIRIRKSDLILFSAPLLHVGRKAGRFVSPFTVFWSVVLSETVSPSGWSRIRFSILGVVVCGRGRGLGEIFVYSCSVFFYSLTTPSTPTSELQSFVVSFPGGGSPSRSISLRLSPSWVVLPSFGESCCWSPSLPLFFSFLWRENSLYR